MKLVYSLLCVWKVYLIIIFLFDIMLKKLYVAAATTDDGQFKSSLS